MVVGDTVVEVDTLVVGGGPGGYTAALETAAHGRRVALVDRSPDLGGVCLNVGCIPSKSLIHVADLAGEARAGSLLGIHGPITVDLREAQAWIRELVGRLRRGLAGRLAAAAVEVVHGALEYVDRRRALVVGASGPLHVVFGETVIATGSTPVELPGVPFDGSRVLDSTGALSLEDVPDRLVVVGGGYVGLELGTAFAKLGSQVQVVEAAAQLLPAFDPHLVRPVARRLADLDVVVRLGTVAVAADASGLVVRAAGAGDAGAAEEHLPADHVVVAVGRRPNTAGLGLERLGVEPLPSGHLAVDEQLRVAPGVFAVGDVTFGPPLAHRAVAQAEVAGRALAGRPVAYEPEAVPNVVYTDPEIVTVGLTTREAEAAGLAVGRSTLPLAASGRAATLGRRDGFLELVTDAGDGTILGVHLVGAGVAELSGEASLAIEMGATAEDLAATIHAHPTLSEGLRDAALATTPSQMAARP